MPLNNANVARAQQRKRFSNALAILDVGEPAAIV
jgi:hypothetical protein